MKQTKGYTKQGVRDLNHLKSKKPREPKAKQHKVTDGTIPHLLTLPAKQDVIYDATAYGEIKDAFPDSKIEHDYNEIKGHRLVISFDESMTLHPWYKWLIESGWSGVSLVFQYSMLTEPDAIRYLLSEIDNEKAI